MKLTLLNAPWYREAPTPELQDACRLLRDDIWREAAVTFYSERAARLRVGKSAPKGIQAELNRVIDARFRQAGWLGDEGRFVCGHTWIRVTFRHQMSLGSDILDAARLHVRERFEQVAIFAAELTFLRVITPNDASALVSFEKLRLAVSELSGVLSTPLVLGALSPASTLPEDIAFELTKTRLRDKSVPAE